MDSAAEFAALQRMHPAALLFQEGGQPVALLPKFAFPAGGKNVEMDLLLHPSTHSGYVTRLFFEHRLEGAGRSQNWTPHVVLGRSWWTPSWKDVAPELPWIGMLGAHLQAVA